MKKICINCGKELTEDKFRKSRNQCKACDYITAKKWKAKNKEKTITYVNKWRDKNKEKYLANHRKKDREVIAEKNNKLHFVENEYSQNKEKYLDKIVDYKESPTGKAYVGLAKSPLMKNDIRGFKGVLIQSENRKLVQCYECGNWYKSLTDKHLKIHRMTIEDYRVKYGLLKNKALISDEYSNYLAAKMNATVNKKGLRPKQSVLNKLLKNKRGKGLKNTIENQNNKGTCEKQLEFRLVEYINTYHRIPSDTSSKGRKTLAPITTLKNRFGSMNNALKHYGLPIRYKQGSTIEYLFEDGYQYFIKNNQGYEDLYQIMKHKCPVLDTI